jgi:hypothetical protein
VNDVGRPPAYLRSVALFNAGHYWLAHEALEDLWRATAEATPRNFYQGIIQLAAAFVHIERGNLGGGSSLLRKAIDKLKLCPATYLGLQPPVLCAALGRVLAATESGQPDRSFDWALRPRLSLEKE